MEEHAHHYSHHHDPKEKKRQINRLSRVIGHLEYVRKMIENDEDCAEVLMQLSAHCITHAIEDGDTEAVEEFKKAIEKFM